MVKSDSVIVTLVLKMKVIVSTIIIVKLAFFVDQTIAQPHSVLTQKLTAVINQLQFRVQIILIHTQVMQKRLGC